MLIEIKTIYIYNSVTTNSIAKWSEARGEDRVKAKAKEEEETTITISEKKWNSTRTPNEMKWNKNKNANKLMKLRW